MYDFALFSWLVLLCMGALVGAVVFLMLGGPHTPHPAKKLQ